MVFGNRYPEQAENGNRQFLAFGIAVLQGKAVGRFPQHIKRTSRTSLQYLITGY